MQTKEVIEEIVVHAKSPFKEARVIDSIEVGQNVRQGDVYLVRIDKAANWKPTENRQLAIGATTGSKHTVDSSVTVLANPSNGMVERVDVGRAKCLGPQVISEDRFTVSHPEHADFSLPAGVYQVQFQCDPQSMQRVRD